MEKLIVDCTTGEQIVVPLTAEEIAEKEALVKKFEADRIAAEEAAEQKAAAKQAIATRLGLTTEELSTLLS